MNEDEINELKRKIPPKLKDKTVFYFRKVEDLDFWVKEYYMKDADNFHIVKNILEKDDTTNYKVIYSINKIEEIFNMQLINNYNDGIWVRNYSLQDILGIVTESTTYKCFKVHNLDMKPYIQTFEEIQQKVNKSKMETIKICEEYLKEYKLFQQLNEKICWDYRMNKFIFKEPMEAVIQGYKKRDEVLRKIMGLPPDTNLKNTSELTLYKIVRDIFPETIYQYRAKWLGKQVIDIFIPNKSIAIEYQGEQHYKAINIFDGERGLERRKYLDARKKALCEQNGVRLIEWKYTEPISTKLLLDKIEHLLR